MAHAQYPILGLGLSTGKEDVMTISSSRQEDDRDLSLLAHDQYFRYLRRIVHMPREDEQRSLVRMARGKAEARQAQPNQWRLMLARHARESLVEGYQPMIVHHARLYHRFCQHVDLLDLIQEGNVALLHALDHNDDRDPRPFCTFASLCIRHGIINALLSQDRLIRISGRCHQLVVMARRVQERLQHEYGCEPSLSNVAQAMQQQEAHLAEAVALERRHEVESLQALLERFEDEADEGVLHLIGLYEPAPGIHPERLVLLREQLQRALPCLSERQRLALAWRYGLDDERPGECSLHEIAERLGCTYNGARNAEIEGRKSMAQVLRLEREADGLRCRLTEEAVCFVEDPWYTWQEAIEKLGCSLGALRRKVRIGELPELVVSRKLGAVYPKAAVDRLAAALQGQAA